MKRFNRKPGRWLGLMAAGLMFIQALIFPAAWSQAQDGPPVQFDTVIRAAHPEAGSFVLYEADGHAVCRQATREEALSLHQRDPDLRLRPITPIRPTLHQQTGLKINLRGTPQLENFPTAKAAFQRAAATWEALIQTPMTVVIDVDFGPTRFGQPYPEGVLGSTDSQQVGGDIYATVRSKLIETASSADETPIYNALPANRVPTDIGSTAGVFTPTSTLRAIGVLPATPDPEGERANLGDPPSIGFNSNFSFDFDPSNGIDADKTDFDATAVHEIGHALGFTSNTGLKELSPTAPVLLSIWDLFRFRPGVTTGMLGTAERILSSGGQQVHFVGSPELQLSTGRPDGSGGDGRQASHWKDDDIIGQYIGIMDPTLPRGTRQEITNNDKLALDFLGYKVNRGGPGPGGDTVRLTSGTPATGSVAAPAPGGGLLAQTQYTIDVPAGATQLKVDLSGNQDVDLYVRFGQRIAIQNGQVVTDYKSETASGTESITITPTSSPALREGTYFIAVGNFGPGAANFTVTATVTGGQTGDTVRLTSGVPVNGSIPAPPANGALLGQTQYTIDVPAGATQLRVNLSGNQDVDLFVRFGQKIVIQNGQPVADYRSETASGTESITITPASSPALRAGTYFIAVGNFGPGAANFTVTATVTSDTVQLTSGVPVNGSIPAPAGGGVLGETQYTINVPAGATQLRVNLSGNQDVDLYVRFGQKIVIQNGQAVADYRSETASGTESITITPASSPALRQGTYFIAVGNFGPGAANFTVTATVN
jgi:uncharacterized protein YneR